MIDVVPLKLKTINGQEVTLWADLETRINGIKTGFTLEECIFVCEKIIPHWINSLGSELKPTDGREKSPFGGNWAVYGYGRDYWKIYPGHPWSGFYECFMEIPPAENQPPTEELEQHFKDKIILLKG